MMTESVTTAAEPLRFRACWACGEPLEGRRRHAEFCSTRCRMRRYRGKRDPRSQRLARAFGLRWTDFWRTPPWLVAAVAVELHLVIDVSACADDRVCREHIPPEADGLTSSWRATEPGAAWWNPAYSPGLLPWVEKAAEEHRRGVPSVGLIPPSLGAAYMQLAADTATCIAPIRGRVPFLHPDTGEPAKGNRGDSCFVFYDGRSKGCAAWHYVNLRDLEARGRQVLDLVADVPNVFPGSAGSILRGMLESPESKKRLQSKMITSKDGVSSDLPLSSVFPPLLGFTERP